MHSDTVAIQFAEATLANARKNQNYYVALLASTQLADIHDRQGDIPKSNKYLAEGSIILQHVKDVGGSGVFIAQNNHFAAQIYSRRQDWVAAEALLLEGLGMAQEGHIRNTEFRCHELLATIHEQRGDLAKALEHYKQFHVAYAQKLFKVLQRLHRAEDFEGSGVGLAIVRRVIERHNWRIWAQATPDFGATFSFTPQSTYKLQSYSIN